MWCLCLTAFSTGLVVHQPYCKIAWSLQLTEVYWSNTRIRRVKDSEIIQHHSQDKRFSINIVTWETPWGMRQSWIMRWHHDVPTDETMQSCGSKRFKLCVFPREMKNRPCRRMASIDAEWLASIVEASPFWVGMPWCRKHTQKSYHDRHTEIRFPTATQGLYRWTLAWCWPWRIANAELGEICSPLHRSRMLIHLRYGQRARGSSSMTPLSKVST